MHYTIQEAIERQDFTLLSREQENELIFLLDQGSTLAESVRCSDVPAGFMNEDEAHEPLTHLHNYETTLLDGNKTERRQALKLLREDLSAWALQAVHSAEYGMSEWRQLVALAKQ